MYNKVIIVQIDSILKYPPTMMLIDNLVKCGIKVSLLSTHVNNDVKAAINNSVDLISIGEEYDYNSSIVKKLSQLFVIRKKVWKAIDRIYDESSIIWVMSNIALKHLGKRLLRYNYNLHLFELVEDVYYIKNYSFTKMNLKKYAKCAKNVIVPEYNRAHITKTWFELDELPKIIENRPLSIDIKKNSPIIHDKKASDAINKLKGKKIILYQGIIDKERPIDFIAEAIDEMGDDYRFLVMTGSNVDYTKYKNTVLVGFVKPPLHLEVSSYAYIGILIYQPVYNTFSSPLNSIYCAPNKLFEYSKFAIPMIGNDIPGLKTQIEGNNMGKCLEHMNKESFKNAILYIEENYGLLSNNSLNFYENDNNINVIKSCL